MKKKLFAILAVVMSIIIGVSVSAGCNLVTTNGKRDLEQVIATVNIGNEGQATTQIYKSDLVMAYLNYGYYLAYNNQMTSSQVFETLVDNLVNTAIMNQYVMKYYEDNNLVEDNSKAQWDVERYLTQDEIADATYKTIKTINTMIDSYEKQEENLYKDTNPETARTVPTDATNEVKELSKTEKADYVLQGIDKGNIGDDRRKAYNKALKVLENNWLLGDEFTNDDLTTSDYYKETLISNEESILLENYNNKMAKSAREVVTYETLKTQYDEMYKAQVNKHTTPDAFKTAMDSATADKPIVYTPYTGFGYVYNLLLGASADQTAEIGKITTTDTNARATERREILDATIAKDLRSTWITSGYDYDYANNVFTGDYRFVEDDANIFQFRDDCTFDEGDALPFQGAVTELKEKTDEEAGEYRIDSVKEFGLDEFIKFIEGYIYNSATPCGAKTDPTDLDYNPSIYYKADIATKPENYVNKINELLFAFSTDGGSLNTYKGYVVAPTPDLDGTETYMKEFANAARELFTMGEGSYIVAATDYGYHFMFYSEYVNASTDYETLEDYLKSFPETSTTVDWAARYNYIIENWDDEEKMKALTGGDLYLYNFITACANADTVVSDKTSEVISGYKYNTQYVVKYESRYADLLGM